MTNNVTILTNERLHFTDLNALLIESQKYGKLFLMRTSFPGWRCSIEMNTNTTGAMFEIKSENDCATPILAAVQCLERMYIALKTLGKS